MSSYRLSTGLTGLVGNMALLLLSPDAGAALRGPACSVKPGGAVFIGITSQMPDLLTSQERQGVFL